MTVESDRRHIGGWQNLVAAADDTAPILIDGDPRRTFVATSQIVFIDGSLPDAQALAAGVAPGVIAILLDPSQDGVQQIADYLATHDVHGLAAIDIVAHGSDGALELGNTLFDATTLADYQTQLATIGGALQPGGSIQLYGCDVAQDAGGVAFLRQLSRATGGASIAAASHLVGAASGGGSWALNVDVGAVTAATPFTADAIANLSGELPLTSDQVFFSVRNGLTDTADNAANRIEEIGVHGSNQASNFVDLTDGNQNTTANTINEPFGIVIDAPLQKFITANGNASSGTLHYGLFEGATNPSGPNQSLTEIYTANTTVARGLIDIAGVALDQPAGKVFFAQYSYDYTAGSVITNQTGIFEIDVSGGTVTPIFTPASTTQYTTPTNLALDTADNLIFFTGDTIDVTTGSVITVLDVANLSTGAIQNLTTLASGMFPGGVAIDSSGTVYFTGHSGSSPADNGIFKAAFTVSGSGSSAQVASFGSVGTLYSGSGADVPEDIAIDPNNGIFYTAGAVSNVAGIFEGSLSHTGAGALTEVFSITSAPLGSGPATNTAPHNLFLESTPTIVASGTVTYAQGGASAILASGASDANQDGQNLASATVVISTGFVSGDTLSGINAGNITTAFSGGTLTLSAAAGGDSLAHFQQVLDSVTFSSTNSNPTLNGTDSTRTIEWTVSDGIIASATPTTTLDIHAAFVNAGATVTFTGGGSPVTLDSGLALGDTFGNGTFNSATVTISNFIAGDTLTVGTPGSLTIGAFNNGTITLSGSASTATYQSALASVQYSFSPANGDPAGGATKRSSSTISWVANDGTVVSPAATSTLDIQHVPANVVAGASVSYPENGTPVILDSGITIADPDSGGNLIGATVSISSGFLNGDTLGFADQNGISHAFDSGTGLLTLSGSASIAEYELALQSITYSFSGDPTNGGTDTSRSISWVVNDGASDSTTVTSSVSTLCFCVGTHIATPSGEVPVEQLVVGDLVLTLDGREVPIRWIGTGQSLLVAGQRSESTPVIVRAHALDHGIPHCDLRITKGHSVYLEGVLIPVENLINHHTILWDDEARSVVVFHLELDSHEVLLANGAPAESYRDDGNRTQFQNVNPGWDIRRSPEPCAPIVTNGPVVADIWQRLLRRAKVDARIPLTEDPDVHLLVNGLRVAPSDRVDGIYVFEIVASDTEVLIASRSVTPAEAGMNHDQRRLGVAVRRILLSQSRMRLAIDSASPVLATGFHGYEAVDDFRWTNGAGLLPSSLFDVFLAGEPIGVEVQVACTARYPELRLAPNEAWVA